MSAIHDKKKPYKCESCSKSFGYSSHLAWHKKKVHEGLVSFQCKICSKSFSSKIAVSNHMSAIHDKKKPYKCESCFKTFGYLNNLSNHKCKINKIILSETLWTFQAVILVKDIKIIGEVNRQVFICTPKWFVSRDRTNLHHKNHKLFFKKWAIPGLFFVYFWSYSNKQYNFYNNSKWKNPSSIQRRDLNPRPLEHESPPITTRPGLPPNRKLFYCNICSREQ